MGGQSCDDCSQCIATEGCVIFAYDLHDTLNENHQRVRSGLPQHGRRDFQEALVRHTVAWHSIVAADASHSQSWFTQSDVDQIKAAGLNTVRIPVRIQHNSPNFEPDQIFPQLGYWIIEDLVNRSNEYFPRGGLVELVCQSKVCGAAYVQLIAAAL